MYLSKFIDTSPAAATATINDLTVVNVVPAAATASSMIPTPFDNDEADVEAFRRGFEQPITKPVQYIAAAAVANGGDH